MLMDVDESNFCFKCLAPPTYSWIELRLLQGLVYDVMTKCNERFEELSRKSYKSFRTESYTQRLKHAVTH